MVLLKMAVKNNKLIKVRDTLMIEDSVGYIHCQFEFRTADWDLCTKTAVFSRGHITPSIKDPYVIRVQLREDGTCVVPAEISADGGSFSIGLYGECNGKVIVTNWLYFKIGQGCYDSGEGTIVPSEGVWDRLYDAIGKKVDKEDGKGLSANDYSTEEKNKLAGIEEGATKTIVIDHTESTSTTDVLSANQGRILNDKIDAINIDFAIDFITNDEIDAIII